MKKVKELHAKLAKQGVRIFNLSIDDVTTTYIHPNKTTEEWRKDVRGLVDGSETTEEDGNANGCAVMKIHGGLTTLGYIEINDIVSDVFEGSTKVTSAVVVDDPAHETQESGFGHYGWEARLQK